MFPPSFPLFHFTPLSRLQTVAREGLLPSDSHYPQVHGTPEKRVCLMARLDLAVGPPELTEAGIVVKIMSDRLDSARLYPDDEKLPVVLRDDNEHCPWWQLDWRKSLYLAGQCGHEGVIGSKLLVIVAQVSAAGTVNELPVPLPLESIL